MHSDERVQLYQSLESSIDLARRQIETRLTGLLIQAGVGIQSISSRLKSPHSLSKKLARPDKTYSSLWDVTDLAGIRVVTFFEDSINEIAALIEKNFVVDYQHSTNKLNAQEHDRFGYRSLHYICSWPIDEQLPGLPREIRFEVQIRTILQHAWAEIEHDLGYKAGDLAAPKIRRRFSRLASLLEIADQEFVSIKDDLGAYVKSIYELATPDDQAIELDAISIEVISEQSEVAAVDTSIAKYLGVDLGNETFFPNYLVTMLKFAGIHTVSLALTRLRAKQNLIQGMTEPYFRFIDEMWGIRFQAPSPLLRGYSLVLLAHLLVLESEALALNKVRRLAEMYRVMDRPSDPNKPLEVANKFVDHLRASGSAEILSVIGDFR